MQVECDIKKKGVSSLSVVTLLTCLSVSSVNSASILLLLFTLEPVAVPSGCECLRSDISTVPNAAVDALALNDTSIAMLEGTRLKSGENC